MKHKTHTATQLSASVKLGEFGRTSMVIKNGEFTEFNFFFSSSLIKAFTFQFVSAWLLPFYASICICFCLVSFEGSLSLFFSFGSAVSPIKAMEWLANRWPSHPINLESSFSHNYFTRPGQTSVSCMDMGAYYKCVCLGFNVMKKRSKNVHESRDWFLGHEYCEAIYQTYTYHTKQYNLLSLWDGLLTPTCFRGIGG